MGSRAGPWLSAALTRLGVDPQTLLQSMVYLFCLRESFCCFKWPLFLESCLKFFVFRKDAGWCYFSKDGVSLSKANGNRSPNSTFRNSAHSLHVHLSTPIIQSLVLPAPNSSKSLKIILKWCLAPTEKITGELLPALGRVKTTVFAC